MFDHRLPLDQNEINRIVAILNGENWVQTVKYPGLQPNEIGVDTKDGKSWRIARPLHLVRLKYHYQKAS